MDILEAIKARHSVRQYENKPIEQEKRDILLEELQKINSESGLNIQILFDEPKCFDSMMAHYGKFSGVTSYIALVGKKSDTLEEKTGYYGEKLALLAQSLGLNTCWVAMTHGKSAAKINKGEKQTCLISLGYGKTQGFAHKSKTIEQLSKTNKDMPDWFKKGMEAVMLAPTAMNQQKFIFELKGEDIVARVSGFGFYSKVDLGIVKYHFEIGSGRKVK